MGAADRSDDLTDGNVAVETYPELSTDAALPTRLTAALRTISKRLECRLNGGVIVKLGNVAGITMGLDRAHFLAAALRAIAAAVTMF
jgi:hypothetical protein